MRGWRGNYLKNIHYKNHPCVPASLYRSCWAPNNITNLPSRDPIKYVFWEMDHLRIKRHFSKFSWRMLKKMLVFWIRWRKLLEFNSFYRISPLFSCWRKISIALSMVYASLDLSFCFILARSFLFFTLERREKRCNSISFQISHTEHKSMVRDHILFSSFSVPETRKEE